jgi:hypothetical protein
MWGHAKDVKGIIVKLRFLIGGVLSLALASPAMASNTWYADANNGNDNNNCLSASAACKTIGHAIDLAHSGDIIRVAAGTYTENLTITFSLRIVGANACTTIIDGGGIAAVVTIPYKIPSSQVTLANVTIRNGFGGPPAGVGDGGGISSDSDLLIIYSIITGNNAGPLGSSGGGVYNGPNGTMDINRSTVSGNTAHYGGGVVCGGGGRNSLSIYNSTISDNHAGNTGGGILGESCHLTITNDTIVGNTSSGGGSTTEGGGITLFSGSLAINNSTVSGNSVLTAGTNNAGGIWVPSNQTVTVQNSILANNTGGNCSGVIVSDGYNLSSDGTCDFNAAGDLINTDPKLGPLLDNGGTRKTMALLPGSPAIDAGSPNGCTDGHGHVLGSDERGYHRPGNPALTTGCDMGAYEVQFPK